MFNARIATCLLIFCFIGCGSDDKANNGTANVNKAEVHAKKHWYTPWRKSEDEWKTEEEEKAAIIAENKARLKKNLAAVDKQLDWWVSLVGQSGLKGNGFIHHNGATELDPWGNLIKIKYYQVNLKEFLEVRSLGPDGKQGTEDDLVRKKHAMNIILAPIAVITYGISLISSIGGSDFDLDPFDIDIG